MMLFSDIVDALAHNKVVDKDGNGKPDWKFDFVDFDACLMSSVEYDLMFADYADYYIASIHRYQGYKRHQRYRRRRSQRRRMSTPETASIRSLLSPA